MRTRTAISIVILCLLLASTALAQPDPGYRAEPGRVAAGGAYRLASIERQTGNSAAGGIYRLWSPAAPKQIGSCCCFYLPCVLRNW